MPDRTKNRSDRYQWIIIESPCSPEMLAECSDAQGVSSILSSNHNEELLDLNERLVKAFWRIVDTKLTKRQSEVLHLLAEGLTQIEIAKKLNVNQSSITKSINGNCDYRNGKKIYGGARKKLKRIASMDPEIIEILGRISEIKSEM